MVSHDLPHSTITSQITFDQRVLPSPLKLFLPTDTPQTFCTQGICVEGKCVRVFLCLIHKHVSAIPVVYELFPHSKVLSKSIIEPDVIMRFNKPFVRAIILCKKGRPGGTCKVESIYEWLQFLQSTRFPTFSPTEGFSNELDFEFARFVEHNISFQPCNYISFNSLGCLDLILQRGEWKTSPPPVLHRERVKELNFFSQRPMELKL